MTRFLSLLLFAALLALTAPVAQAQSLYADPKAHQPGDVLRVILQERTSAQRSSAFDSDSDASVGGSGSVSGGGLSGTFAADATYDAASSSENETAQQELLTGTMTARVLETDEVGNLLIAGERKLNVNGVTHVMKVTGVVRPLDIAYNNTVHSYEIADASIVYRQDGLTKRFLKPGWFARVGAVALLGAAVFFAAN